MCVFLKAYRVDAQSFQNALSLDSIGQSKPTSDASAFQVFSSAHCSENGRGRRVLTLLLEVCALENATAHRRTESKHAHQGRRGIDAAASFPKSLLSTPSPNPAQRRSLPSNPRQRD